MVAELDFIKGETKDGVEFRVYTEKGRSELGQFALDCGMKVLPFFANFFAIAYPLPKMDMIAVRNLSTQCYRSGGKHCWTLVSDWLFCIVERLDSGFCGGSHGELGSCDLPGNGSAPGSKPVLRPSKGSGC